MERTLKTPKTRVSLALISAALTLMSACQPEAEMDSTEDLEAGSDVGGQVVNIPDSLSFARADLNGDSVIEQNEFRSWLERQSTFAPDAPESDSASVSDSAGAGPHSVWRENLDLTLTEAEWRNSGRHLYTRTSESGLFGEWDTNGDLRLDPLEALAGLDARGENQPLETGPISTRDQLSSALFRLWDIDGNGRLEPDEYRDGIAVWWL